MCWQRKAKVHVHLQIRRRHHKGKSHGGKVSKSLNQNWGVMLAGQWQRFLPWAGEVGWTGQQRHLIFSKHCFLGTFAIQAVTVTSQFSLYLVRFLSVIYKCPDLLPTDSIIKLWHSKNKNEETKAKIVFLLTWAHKRWKSKLAKDISSQRQYLSPLCNWQEL